MANFETYKYADSTARPLERIASFAGATIGGAVGYIVGNEAINTSSTAGEIAAKVGVMAAGFVLGEAGGRAAYSAVKSGVGRLRR